MKVDLLTIPYTSIFLDVGIIDCFSRLSFIPIERLFPNTSIWPQTTEWFCNDGVHWMNKISFFKVLFGRCEALVFNWFIQKDEPTLNYNDADSENEKAVPISLSGESKFFFLRENIFVEKKRGLTRKTLDFIILHLARKLLLKNIRNYISKLFGLFLKKFRRVQISFQNANSNPLPL